jgi:hypothetical protein
MAPPLSARGWRRIFYGRLDSRRIPLILLIAALAGIVFFSSGLRLIDTVGMLACGVIAGGSLAAIAAGRRR